MAFQYKQRIAPMRSGRFPSPGDFFEVDCYDISAGGFSFFLDREPDFDTLAVELGTPPRQSFLAARVRPFHLPRVDRKAASARRLPVPRTPVLAHSVAIEYAAGPQAITHWMES